MLGCECPEFWRGRKESNPLGRGVGSRRSTDELHPHIGAGWQDRTAVYGATIRRSPIELSQAVGACSGNRSPEKAIKDKNGRDGMHRTSDLPVMSGTLWPSELRHGLAGEDGIEPPTVRFKICCATGCATRPKLLREAGMVLPSGFDPPSPL
jgi:hypothetical protein